jgi:hypothetical protein
VICSAEVGGEGDDSLGHGSEEMEEPTGLSTKRGQTDLSTRVARAGNNEELWRSGQIRLSLQCLSRHRRTMTSRRWSRVRKNLMEANL